MKKLLWFLAVLGLTTSVASAGPNTGGVIWVHDTGLTFTVDPPVPPVNTPPADCAGVDNELPLSDGSVRGVWKVYAAFPPGSSPRLKTCGWGIQFPDAGTSPASYVSVSGGDIPDEDGAGTDFYIGTEGFPTASGGEIGQSFPTGPRTATVVTLFHFYGFGYNTSGPLPTFSVVENSAPGNRVFGDDADPTNEDPIMGYGSLGFGQPGTTPCPSSDPDAACCAVEGTCELKKEADCSSPAVWHREWYVCDPNPCPQPTGACCYTDGRCQATMAFQCDNGGGIYQGDFVPCLPSPCLPAAACCMPSGSCLVRTQAACAALDPANNWYAEEASCTPNPCSEVPTGSCCAANGTCTIETQADCNAGTWTLSGSCVPNLCPAPAVEGACCSAQGVCTLKLQADCPALQWHGGPICDPNPCSMPLGACCALDGACTMTTESGCEASMTWHVELLSCVPNQCPLLPVESTSWGQLKNRYR